jgi:hypothetical protein
VDFVRPKTDAGVDVRELAFEQGVYLESETRDRSGTRKSSHRMQVPSLALNQLTGDLHADGPGWLAGVQRSSQRLLGKVGAKPQRSASDGLEFIRVDFSREMVGRLHLGQIECSDHVRCIYGPVEDWDESLEDVPSTALGEKTVILTCERLAIADMSPKPGSLDDLEMAATGNAFVRGRSFSASGYRVSFVRSKGQVVLEGDGRNDALLRFRKQPAATPTDLKAGKIMFWPDTHDFELNDARSLELRDLEQFRNASRGR